MFIKNNLPQKYNVEHKNIITYVSATRKVKI